MPEALGCFVGHSDIQVAEAIYDNATNRKYSRLWRDSFCPLSLQSCVWLGCIEFHSILIRLNHFGSSSLCEGLKVLDSCIPCNLRFGLLVTHNRSQLDIHMDPNDTATSSSSSFFFFLLLLFFFLFFLFSLFFFLLFFMIRKAWKSLAIMDFQ